MSFALSGRAGGRRSGGAGWGHSIAFARPRAPLQRHWRESAGIMRGVDSDEQWTACVDYVSGGSYGGFVLSFPGSGAFAWRCLVPAKLTDSTAGSELIMAVTAAKTIMGFRMFAAELGQRQADPTELGMDAMAVLDGTKMIKVSREQRYLAARLAMLRTWVEDSVISLVKIHTDNMVADIMTKVLPVAAFTRHRASLMGSADRGGASVSGIEGSTDRKRGRRSGAKWRSTPPAQPPRRVYL